MLPLLLALLSADSRCGFFSDIELYQQEQRGRKKLILLCVLKDMSTKLCCVNISKSIEQSCGSSWTFTLTLSYNDLKDRHAADVCRRCTGATDG